MPDQALDMAVSLIASFEGFVAEPYKDVAGVETIGYGFTYLPTMRPVTAATPPMSEPDARAWLQTIVAKTLAAVREMAHVTLTDGQAAALTSLAYNEGTAAIRDSTLMRFLNQGRVADAAEQFMAWTYAGDKVLAGLRNRRAKERAVFLGDQVKTPAIPAALSVETDAPGLSDQESDDLNAAELVRIHSQE